MNYRSPREEVSRKQGVEKEADEKGKKELKQS
jgi:hypothetical protein